MAERASERTCTRIMVATRLADIPPELAHQVRVRVRAGVSAVEADQILDVFRRIPAKRGPKTPIRVPKS